MRLLPGGSFVHPQHFPVAVYGDECSDGGLNVRGNDVKANVVTSNFQFSLSLIWFQKSGMPTTHEGGDERKWDEQWGEDGCACFVITHPYPKQSPILRFKVCLAANNKLDHPRRPIWRQTSMEVSSGQAPA